MASGTPHAFRAGGEPLGHTVPTRGHRRPRHPLYRPRQAEVEAGASSRAQRCRGVRCGAVAPHQGPCGFLRAVVLAPRLRRKTRMGSLHGQQLVIRRYHTRGEKMKRKNFQLVTIFGSIALLERNGRFSGVRSSGTENEDRL